MQIVYVREFTKEGSMQTFYRSFRENFQSRYFLEQLLAAAFEKSLN